MIRAGRLVEALVVFAVAIPAWGIGAYDADLYLPGKGTPTERVHADTFDTKELGGLKFTVFADPGGLGGQGFTHLAGLDMESAFSGEGLDGALRTQVWEHTDGHLLFAYQLDNAGLLGFEHMRIGNIAGYDDDIAIVDSGVLHVGGTSEYESGDILEMGRTTDGVEAQLFFAFYAYATDWSTVRRYLQPGESSTWFYVDTDMVDYTVGVATVQNGGVSHDDIPVLIAAPIPEPLTVLGLTMALASLGGYISRRRR